MVASWQRSVAPDFEPISLEEAKAQMRVTHSDEDGVILGFIAAARETGEEYLGRAIPESTWVLALSDWADEVPLPMAAPVQSITSVEYYNESGTLTTLSSTYYALDSIRRPAYLMKAPNQVWPALQSDRRTWRVKVTYVAGWASAAVVPERIRQGIRLYLAHLDLNRDGSEASAALARKAAEACWSDRVFFPPVECW